MRNDDDRLERFAFGFAQVLLAMPHETWLALDDVHTGETTSISEIAVDLAEALIARLDARAEQGDDE